LEILPLYKFDVWDSGVLDAIDPSYQIHYSLHFRSALFCANLRQNEFDSLRVSVVGC
jgi:hypothetical protein